MQFLSRSVFWTGLVMLFTRTLSALEAPDEAVFVEEVGESSDVISIDSKEPLWLPEEASHHHQRSKRQVLDGSLIPRVRAEDGSGDYYDLDDGSDEELELLTTTSKVSPTRPQLRSTLTLSPSFENSDQLLSSQSPTPGVGLTSGWTTPDLRATKSLVISTPVKSIGYSSLAPSNFDVR